MVKVHVKKDRIKNIAMMSIPAAMIAPVSIPFALLMAIVSGSLLSTVNDDEYEIEISWVQWKQIISEAHKADEEKKRLNTLYWRK